jgi:hypothetical protein
MKTPDCTTHQGARVPTIRQVIAPARTIQRSATERDLLDSRIDALNTRASGRKAGKTRDRRRKVRHDPEGRDMNQGQMRRHHEELAAAPSILPALSLLIPFVGALWARITSTKKTSGPQGTGEV